MTPYVQKYWEHYHAHIIRIKYLSDPLRLSLCIPTQAVHVTVPLIIESLIVIRPIAYSKITKIWKNKKKQIF